MSFSSSDVPDRCGLLASLRVLLVEDDDDGRDCFAFVLAGQGAVVTAVGSTADALAALDRDCPDVLVSDIGLPDADGCELIRRVRGLDGPRSIVPAAAVTAYGYDEMRVRVLEAGFQVHVVKPVASDHLVAVVAGLVARTGSLRRLARELAARHAGNRAELARVRAVIASARQLSAESRRLREHSRALREGRPIAT
jgi:CheY-like chemotaxis protein